MSRLNLYRRSFIIAGAAVLCLVLGVGDAYSQCGALCAHERTGGRGVSAEGLFSADETYPDGNEPLYAQAGETTTDSTFVEAPSDKWQFAIIPYLWLMGINGKTTIKGRTSNLNVSFGDIWDNLDFAAEVHIEAWKDRYGFFIDTSFA